MNEVPRPAGTGKWEVVRRLRYGALLNLFRHRWGKEFPDDDAGREDLFELIMNLSLAPAATEKKIANAIELWAPWMQHDEAQMMVDHVQRLHISERLPTAKTLGVRVRLTNSERERLRLWPIAPIDMTDEQLAEQRKAKRQERDAKRRRNNGSLSREAYLAQFASREQPWKAEGISRRTWERRRGAGERRDHRANDAGERQTIVVNAERSPATASKVETQRKGQQGSGEVKSLRETTDVKKPERQERGGSPDIGVNLRHGGTDERLIALENWGENRKKKAWTKPSILSDEAPDLERCSLEEGARAV